MRGRPDVDMRMPSAAHPGDDVPIEILLDVASRTPIDFVDLTWTGEEIFSVLAEGEQRSGVRTLVAEKIRLLDAGTLEPGKLRKTAVVKVPPDAPGSYMGVRITIRYELQIHVSIPWWPDLRETFELTVEPRPAPRPKPEPRSMTLRRDGRPSIELSVASDAFAPGEEIAGAFAVADLPRRADLGVELSLVAIESVKHETGTLRAELFRHMVPSVFRAPANGVEVPFRFRVPKDVVPTFRSAGCDLSWNVQATLRLGWEDATTAFVVVTIGRFAAAGDAAEARPRIGAERWQKVWREVGEPSGLTVSGEQLALTGARGDVRIEIAKDESEETPMLVATLRYPSIELDLRVARRFLVMLPNELEMRVPGHRIECRSIDQAGAFLTAPLCEELLRFRDMRIDDARAVVRDANSGLDAPRLERFVHKIVRLADTLGAAILAIPPPVAMKDMLPAWRSFAASTGAHLAVGGMALFSASVDGALFDVATTFGAEGEPTGTRVTLELDPPLPFRVSMAHPESFSAASPGAHDLAKALAASVAGLEIDPYSIRIQIAGPTPHPEDLRPRMGELVMLARRLRGERTPGPYR